MVMATAVEVAAIADLEAGNLQDILGQIYGKAQWAAEEVGSALYKADAAQTKADSLEGSINWATAGVGTIDYHLREIANLVGYGGYPAVLGAQAPEQAPEA